VHLNKRLSVLLSQVPRAPMVALNPKIEQRLSLMYNPLRPWNAFFALSSQPARVWWATQAGMWRGITQSVAIAKSETDRMVTENGGAAEAQIPAVARKPSKKHQVAKKAMAVGANRDRRNRHRARSDRVRSGRVDHRVKKIQKGRSAVRQRKIGGLA
jgi:hypothetical protein